MAPLLAAALVTAGTGVLQGVQGAIQKGKANSMASRNKRPVYTKPQGINDNLALAESRAQEGMSDGAKQIYKQETEHGLTAAISAITNNGGSVNNVGDLYGKYQEGIGRMSLVDDEMRVRNNQVLMGANKDDAEYDDKEFMVNEWAPYADTAQAAAALSKQGNDNMWKGINTVASAGINYAAGKMYQNEAEGVYGQHKVNMDAPAMVRPREQTIPIIKNLSTTYPGLDGLAGSAPMTTAMKILSTRELLPGQIPSKDAVAPPVTAKKPIDWRKVNFLTPNFDPNNL